MLPRTDGMSILRTLRARERTADIPIMMLTAKGTEIDKVMGLDAGADGVHLGQDDLSVAEARRLLGPDAIIGATAHCAEEALEAQRRGADYLGVGAAFGSQTKRDAKPIDRGEYRRIAAAVKIPVAAIGGINQDNIMQLCGAGLAGVAVISAIYASGSIENAAARLLELSRRL